MTAKRYEAVIGYDLDEDAVTWGYGDSCIGAIADACERFVTEQHDYIEPGEYEATCYLDPLERDESGYDVIYDWSRRWRCAVTITTMDGEIRWTIGPRHDFPRRAHEVTP
jgi:hypothetical protein